MTAQSSRRGDAPMVIFVEGDKAVRALVVVALGREGITVREAADVERALVLTRVLSPDLVLLDAVLPGSGAIDALPRFRELGVPLILLTGRDEVSDRVLGSNLGADDYVVKPFNPHELASAVRAVLHRTDRSARGRAEPVRLVYDGLEIDLGTRDVSVAGSLVTLTALEFDLLAYLAAHPRQVCSREELLEHVWNSSADWQQSASVTEHVGRVRHKIESDPGHPRWLLTVRGVGYRFEP